MNLMDIFQIQVGPNALTWCAIITTVLLAVYALSGKGFQAPDAFGKIQLPDLTTRGRIGVGCAAVLGAVLSVVFYQQAIRADADDKARLADAAYSNEVLDRTAGKSAVDLGNIYSVLFKAAGNDNQRCILETAISARVQAAEAGLDPPVIPDDIIGEIQAETRSSGSSNRKHVACYTQLASDLALAVKRRKALAAAKAAQLKLDPVVVRDTPDGSEAESALAQLAPFPTASGWVYIGKLTNGVLEPNPGLGQLSHLPAKGDMMTVEGLVLVERTEPDLFAQEPDVAGVYETPTGVFVDAVDQAHAKPYAYAAVHFATPAPVGALSEKR